MKIDEQYVFECNEKAESPALGPQLLRRITNIPTWHQQGEHIGEAFLPIGVVHRDLGRRFVCKQNKNSTPGVLRCIRRKLDNFLPIFGVHTTTCNG